MELTDRNHPPGDSTNIGRLSSSASTFDTQTRPHYPANTLPKRSISGDD